MAGWLLVKVALLSDCYLPRLGGIEVQVHDLAHHLSAAGHTVEVFTATGDPAHPRSNQPRRDEQGVLVHRFDLGLPGGIPVNPFAVPEVRRRLAGSGFDVAHVHMGVVSPFAVDMARVALGVGLPTAVTWHCVLDRSAWVHQRLGYAARWASMGAALSAVSAMAAERVGRLLPDGTPVNVIGNGIEVVQWQRPADRSPMAQGDDEAFRVVAVQRLVRRKRPEALIDVLLQARALVPADLPMVAEIVGDGPQRAAVERAVAEHPWIRVRGRLSRPEIRDLHWGSHAFLSTTVLEAFGIAALEARTAGVPVLALRGTGVSDIVEDGVTGVLAADDAGLAAALARLVTDRARQEALAARAREVAPVQAWPAIVSASVAEYERAMAGHAAVTLGDGAGRQLRERR